MCQELLRLGILGFSLLQTCPSFHRGEASAHLGPAATTCCPGPLVCQAHCSSGSLIRKQSGTCPKWEGRVTLLLEVCMWLTPSCHSSCPFCGYRQRGDPPGLRGAMQDGVELAEQCVWMAVSCCAVCYTKPQTPGSVFRNGHPPGFPGACCRPQSPAASCRR